MIIEATFCWLLNNFPSSPPLSAIASNPCEANGGRGPCSHLCLINYNRTASCACPHLMKISADNFTCFGEWTSPLQPLVSWSVLTAVSPSIHRSIYPAIHSYIQSSTFIHYSACPSKVSHFKTRQVSTVLRRWKRHLTQTLIMFTLQWHWKNIQFQTRNPERDILRWFECWIARPPVTAAWFWSLKAGYTKQCQCPVFSCPSTALKRFLLYVRRTEIRGVDIDNPYLNLITALTVPDIDDVTAVDYDASEERIYWTDVKTQTIKRSSINGTAIETIISGGRERCSPLCFWNVSVFRHLCNETKCLL